MGGLLCGACKADITPPEEWLGGLHGLKRSRFGGVADKLYVRAVILKNDEETLAIISFDMDKAPAPGRGMRMIREKTGIPEDHILYTAIHTHSAPITGERPGEGPNALAQKPGYIRETTEKYEAYVLEKMLLSVCAALKKLKPARVSYGSGKCDINVNRIAFRDIPDKSGRVRRVLGTGADREAFADKTLFVMEFSSLSGEPIAFFINYPVHNTVMIFNSCFGSGKSAVSSDLGGNVSRLVEAEYKGSVCLWTSGAAGDLNPVMSNQISVINPETCLPEEGYDNDREKPVMMLRGLSRRQFSDVCGIIGKIGSGSHSPFLSASSSWISVPGNDGQPYRVHIRCMTCGSVIFLGISGELYSGLGKRLRERISPLLRDPDTPLIFINHDASLLCDAGYIYGDEIFALAEKYEGEIVGMNHTRLKPGYIENALFSRITELIPGFMKQS